MSGAAQPFEIETDPQPDTRAASITIDEDNNTIIDFPSNKPAPRQKATPKGHEFDRNLAEDIDETSLKALAAYILEGIDADKSARSEWLETANATADYLGIRLQDPASQVAADGTICQAVATCMLQAAAKMWATACAELLPAAGPVKVERVDPTPIPSAISQSMGPAENSSDAEQDDLADALERDMNWYLTNGDRGYYPDTRAMIMQRNLIGLGFKEIYYCNVAKKPLSRFVRAQDMIIQGNPPNINETDGRVTVRKKVSQSRMKRLMKAGVYRDIQLVRPTDNPSETELVVGDTQGISASPTLPRDFEHTVYETTVELGSGTTHDLFGDLELLDLDENRKEPGFPLPYRVAVDEDSREVLGLRRGWKKGDKDYKRKRRFVKFGLLPSFGYYDWGLIHLAGNPTQAATMLLRSGVDAAVLANFPAWVMKQGPGSKLENRVMRPGPGEVMLAAVAGNDKLQDALMRWPYAPPSPESIALSQKLESDVKSLAGIVELPVGEGRIGNTPVGTIMSYIESVTMVPGEIHKADHIAQGEEFEMLRELLAEDPASLTRGNRTPARQWQASEELMSRDLSPAADPNTPSQMHRLLKVQGRVMLGGLPQFQGIADNRAIYRNANEVLGGGDSREFEMPEQQGGAMPPDPRVMAAQIKAEQQKQTDQMKMAEAQVEHQAKMQELAVTSQDKEADRQATNQREMMKQGIARQKTGADLMTAGAKQAHEAGQNAMDRTHEAGITAAGHAHEASMGMADKAHEVGMAGMDMTHQADQASQDRNMEAGGMVLDKAHEAGMAGMSQAHEAEQADQDRDHEVGMAGMDMTHQADQAAEDRKHEAGLAKQQAQTAEKTTRMKAVAKPKAGGK